MTAPLDQRLLRRDVGWSGWENGALLAGDRAADMYSPVPEGGVLTRLTRLRSSRQGHDGR